MVSCVVLASGRDVFFIGKFLTTRLLADRYEHDLQKYHIVFVCVCAGSLGGGLRNLCDVTYRNM